MVGLVLGTIGLALGALLGLALVGLGVMMFFGSAMSDVGDQKPEGGWPLLVGLALIGGCVWGLFQLA